VTWDADIAISEAFAEYVERLRETASFEPSGTPPASGAGPSEATRTTSALGQLTIVLVIVPRHNHGSPADIRRQRLFRT
jgi:hypothetical protein